MTDDKTVEDVLREMRDAGSALGPRYVYGDTLSAFANRIEQAWQRERASFRKEIREWTAQVVREHLGLLVDWEQAPKRADSAMVAIEYYTDDTDHEESQLVNRGVLAEFERPKPEWVPKRGDRVRWVSGNDSGTGTYDRLYDGTHRVHLGPGEWPLWVDYIEPLTEEDT